MLIVKNVVLRKNCKISFATFSMKENQAAPVVFFKETKVTHPRTETDHKQYVD